MRTVFCNDEVNYLQKLDLSPQVTLLGANLQVPQMAVTLTIPKMTVQGHLRLDPDRVNRKIAG